MNQNILNVFWFLVFCPLLFSGNHSFNTTHDTTYQNIKGDHRVKPLVQPDTTPLRKRGNFQGKTQTMLDFPGYSRGQPKPPKAAEPAPATIDLKFDNKYVCLISCNMSVFTL